MENKFKVYKDSKELPFFIYKRIMQTGDFLYMVKGYDPDEGCMADPKEMELKFNSLIQEFVNTVNESSEDVLNHSKHAIATVNFNHLTYIYDNIDNLNRCSKILDESLVLINKLSKEDQSDFNAYECFVKDINDTKKDISTDVTSILEGIKIERNTDLDVQLKLIKNKIDLHESNIQKYKELIESVSKEESDIDIDRQLLNVCLGLEMPLPDESKLSLYQFSVMTDIAIERYKELEKINTR